MLVSLVPGGCEPKPEVLDHKQALPGKTQQKAPKPLMRSHQRSSAATPTRPTRPLGTEDLFNQSRDLEGFDEFRVEGLGRAWGC